MDWGLMVTAGIILSGIGGEAPPADCVDPEMVTKPDSSVDAHIAVYEPKKRVDPTMVQSPPPECTDRPKTLLPEQD
jgi:hypothetical protein